MQRPSFIGSLPAKLGLIVCVCATPCMAQIESESTREALTALRSQTITALQRGERELAFKSIESLIEQDGDRPATMMLAADVYLRFGKSEEAVQWFDRFLESSPESLPALWQRGIALYFAGDYKRGAAQFEEHRRVNPNDVENAAWHFLCVAKADSIEAARRMVLPAPNDPRVPMKEVLAMLSNGDTETVRQRMESVPPETPARERAEFYGNFYLGLYADANGNQKEALDLLSKSAAEAPHHYMGDVARVYVQFLKAQLASKSDTPDENE